MRQYKYTSKFTATARCTLDVEKGKHLATASLNDLKALLPPDADKYPDLLPIVANACVANIGNAWGDLIDTDLAKKIHPKFTYKYINLEHDRNQIVGVITTAGLSSFNSSYSLGSGSEIKNPDEIVGFEPFNITVGGFIWRIAHEDVASKLIEANDPNSPLYLTIAMSWELGFDDYILMAGSQERDGKDVELITDPKRIEALASGLKSKGGKNRTPDGRPLYRIITASKFEDGTIDEDSVVPLGVGLTFSPAGAVAGVVTPLFEAKASINENNEKNNSQNENGIVSTNIRITMKTLKSFDDLKNLNDETVKEYSFANIGNLIEANEVNIKSKVSEALNTAAEEWSVKINAEKLAIASAEEKASAAQKKVEEVEASLEAAKKEIETLKASQEQAAASELFNQRMAHFDDKYELTDTDRKAIASRIKSLDDKSFSDFAENEFAVFAAAKVKKTPEVAVASAPVTQPVVTPEQALANVTPQVAPVVPNTPNPQEGRFAQYAGAFKLGEGIKVSKK